MSNKYNGFSKHKVSIMEGRSDEYTSSTGIDDTQQSRKEKVNKMMKRDPRKVFVGGLPSQVMDEEFREFFTQFGNVVDSVVIFDNTTHRSRGFGFVTFEDKLTADKVLGGSKEFGTVVIRGKECELKPAEPKFHSHYKPRKPRPAPVDMAPAATVSSTSETASLQEPPEYVAIDHPYVPQTPPMQFYPYDPSSFHPPPNFYPPIMYNHFPPQHYPIPFYPAPPEFLMQPMHVPPDVADTEPDNTDPNKVLPHIHS